jgi:hypothetical protein
MSENGECNGCGSFIDGRFVAAVFEMRGAIFLGTPRV